jgi:NADPH-ferrihemoprotein reductase
VWIERGSLALPPADVPTICVGPGTGVAPFRSFMHERAALLQSGAAVAPSVLLFGCRNEAKDFLYAAVRPPFL